MHPADPRETNQHPPEIGEEAKITSHAILYAFGNERRGVEILHRDLFDSSSRVVLSALRTLGKVHDTNSLRFIAQLLSREDEETRCAAVRTLGTVGGPAAVRILSELVRLSKNEQARCAALEGLAEAAPAEVLALTQEQATSRFVSPLIRRCAASLFIRNGGEQAMTTLLGIARADEVEELYGRGREQPELLPAILKHGLDNYERLPASARVLLVSVAAESADLDPASLLTKALADAEATVRSAAYAAVGAGPGRARLSPNLVSRLIEQVEPDPRLEEEILLAVERIERATGIGAVSSVGIRERLISQIRLLFGTLSGRDKSAVSDTHELGWLMTRAREYLEFYASKEFRSSLLHYLRGESHHGESDLITALKESAVRVEVGHFDGFRALSQIIRDPKRPGMALVTREIANARLGVRDPFNRLVRSLRLTRLIDGVGPGSQGLFLEIFAWAKDARLFRLAEAALYALARVDAAKATELCRRLIEPPIDSKILAIATARLLRELEWTKLEPAVVRLIAAPEDSLVLLNLIDALSVSEQGTSLEVLKAMVSLLHHGEIREVVQQAGAYLAAQQAPNLLESLLEGFERREPWRQQVILALAERTVVREGTENRSALTELLYRILRSDENGLRPIVAVFLLRLGDDYATRVLSDIVGGGSSEEKVELVRHLREAVTGEVASILYPLVGLENPALHEALRDTFLSAAEQKAQDRILDLTLALRNGGSSEASESAAPEGGDEEIRVELLNEKKAFRFEREYIQEVAVLFTDIQGYSKKAQVLSSLQLTALIQDYENILVPTVSTHRGELIKRMGDGHLFVFQSAIGATLAAIRLQKSLRRFNSYREESQRLTIRVGVHWGKVVRKDGDVLGNHVNIASRLEGSAKGGSILISDAVFERLGGHILCNEIGLIEVKNISEPVKVYEPYEIGLDLPPNLDPLSSPEQAEAVDKGAPERAGGHVPRAEGRTPSRPAAPNRLLADLGVIFAQLNGLCVRVEKGEATTADLRRELVIRWRAVKSLLPAPGAGDTRQPIPSAGAARAPSGA